LSGEDFDNRLVNHFVQAFKRKHKKGKCRYVFVNICVLIFIDTNLSSIPRALCHGWLASVLSASHNVCLQCNTLVRYLLDELHHAYETDYSDALAPARQPLIVVSIQPHPPPTTVFPHLMRISKSLRRAMSRVSPACWRQLEVPCWRS